MELFGHSTPQSVLLESFHPPLGLNVACCVPHVVTPVREEKMWSFSGNYFRTQNSAVQDVVRCHGQAFIFVDTRQTPLFIVRNKVFPFHETQLIEAMDVGSSHMTASFHGLASASAASSSHDLIELESKGDWFERSAIITLLSTESVIGQISRKILNMGWLRGSRLGVVEVRNYLEEEGIGTWSLGLLR
ncbi:uncharacterized protein STEHIDRAFT_160209 [Stereum hirsutum FP-91666 SS1]|uniref:uncharacterized protein n=1 Tax=Stereum hirsutum (strain FP-91666) TaxID=721885 RepID=UPI0004449E20|nr:uncharacterized protein STEHIDRAFT_160209 [Stereum hirsutum FP-91666 SS1]EIM83634.1 hypothetical protein STEHIDRAFT_160209 [Stereum hirsutum FP-91666 SS1]